MGKLLLIDAFALLYRAYFAHRNHPRTTAKGLHTGAILGFSNTLFEVLAKEKPSHVAIGIDTHGPTFRSELYAEYKATRQQQPEEITAALPYIQRLLSALRIVNFAVPGYEADDIIGTLVKQCPNIDCVLFTPDKDYAQLVNTRVSLLKPAYKKTPPQRLGIAEVQSTYGVLPEQIVDLLALQGDASDNIPGVAGIGPKTACTLLQDHKNIEALYEAIDAHQHGLKDALVDKLQKNRAAAFLSKKLATIYQDIELHAQIDDLKCQAMDQQALGALFNELEFRTLSKRILPTTQDLFAPTAPKSADITLTSPVYIASSTPPRYHQITTPAACRQLLPYIQQARTVGIHFVFHEEKAIMAQPTILGLCYNTAEAFAIVLQDNAQALLQALSPIFTNPDILRVSMQAKADYLLLRRHGIEPTKHFFDLCVAQYVLTPEGSLDGTRLAKKHLPTQEQYYVLQTDTWSAAQQAHQALALYPPIQKSLEDNGQTKLYEELEAPLIEVLARMEQHGVLVQEDILTELSAQYTDDLSRIEQQVHTLAEETFNILSPKQLGEVLFGKMQLAQKPRKTKTGFFSTSEDVLQNYTQHEIVRKVLEYRGLHKLLATYIEGLPKFISREDQRIHTDFRQTVAATGRLSSTSPNLQNIPIRTERGKHLRAAFVAPADYQLLSADYSQIELRIMAAFAQETAMLKAFADNIDIHTLTASQIFHIEPTAVTTDQRRLAKSTNFGIIYGISAFGLANTLHISRQEAQDFIQRYFAAFPKIYDYMQAIKVKAAQDGYVATLWGRRRYLPDITSKNAAIKNFAERNAINAPIQGTAADIIKKAMGQVDAFLHEHHPKARLILQIHDELLIEAPTNDMEAVKKALPDLMENIAPDLGTLLKINIHVGLNWREAH